MNALLERLDAAAWEWGRLSWIPANPNWGLTELRRAREAHYVELIIRECAQLVDHEMSLGGIDGRAVLEHFGVDV